MTAMLLREPIHRSPGPPSGGPIHFKTSYTYAHFWRAAEVSEGKAMSGQQDRIERWIGDHIKPTPAPK
jgi:hypothetical protein